MGGKLYGVGVGPGNPELMTLKAVRVIREADTIVLPAPEKDACYAYRIAHLAVPEIDDKVILCRNFPMTKDEAVLDAAITAVCDELKGLLMQGHVIAFLTLGDPTVYATYHYVHRRLAADGFDAEIVSGVPSFCAAAGALGISLGDRSEQIQIIPASYTDGAAESASKTRVYMKSGQALARLKEALLEESKAAPVTVYGVANCGMENERRMYGLEELDEQSGYLTVVIVKKE